MIMLARGHDLGGWLGDDARNVARQPFDALCVFESVNSSEWLVIARFEPALGASQQDQAVQRWSQRARAEAIGLYEPAFGCSEDLVCDLSTNREPHPLSVFAANVHVGSEPVWRSWYPAHFRAVLELPQYHAGMCLERCDRGWTTGAQTMFDFVTIYQLASNEALQDLLGGKPSTAAKRAYRCWEQEGAPMTSTNRVTRFLPCR